MRFPRKNQHPIVRKGANADTGNAGHFATTQHDEAADGINADLSGRSAADVPEIDLDAIVEADTDQLWDYVEHEDWRVRMYACAATNLSTEQLRCLSDLGQEVPVRLAAAALSNPGVAARAAEDPSPIVRHRALTDGWDLPAETTERLRRDREVARVGAVLGATRL